MALTLAQQLAEVETAITKVLAGGQSYRIGSRQMTRADLSLLRQMKYELEQQIASAEDDGVLSNFSVAQFDRR